MEWSALSPGDCAILEAYEELNENECDVQQLPEHP